MTYAQELKRWRREYWLRLMREHGGNIIAMAKASGSNRTSVHKRVVELGLRNAVTGCDRKYVGVRRGRRYVAQLRLPMDYPLLCEE